MEYNTERTPLYMPEYGRLIQSLVEHCKALPTKEERNEMANAIIAFIGQKKSHIFGMKKIIIINFGITFLSLQIIIWM